MSKDVSEIAWDEPGSAVGEKGRHIFFIMVPGQTPD